ncbi:hypothetical protein B0H11DRAFT_2210464 [Mycena galericulata]|nr:hypothetical protein B0H11DRAFT_2210464 [Mycena galericulata]
MFHYKFLLSLTLVALFSVASAVPANLKKRGTDESASVVVCSSPSTGCVAVPVVSDDCVNLTGGLSFLNDEITTTEVPGGFVCTFFQAFGCTTGTGNPGICTAAGTGNVGQVVLQGGTWNMSVAPGLSGPVDFNDLTSSFSCSPV